MKPHHKSTAKPGWLTASLCAISLILAACGGSETQVEASLLSCNDSIKTSFKPDAQTSVLLVKEYKKGDVLPNPVQDTSNIVSNDLCMVKLLVGPGNPGPSGAPSTSAGIGIEVWLPAKANWNGRHHAVGGGGFGGTEETDLTMVSSGTGSPDYRSAPGIAASEGAMTSSTDTGHRGASSPIPQLDGSFAMSPNGTINTALWADFSSRAIHEQMVKAKALAKAYYGAVPKWTYWDSASTGGRQGLKQAQRYPGDFDGIIVNNPAINWTRFTTAELYPQIVVQRDLGGAYMTPEQLLLASVSAISSCDMVGGVHLGFVLDPSACRYDPTKDATVICSANGGSNSSLSCLTPTQANAINKIWYGMTSDGSVPDPAVDNGWAQGASGVRRWYGLQRGTDLSGLASSFAFPIAANQVALELQNPTLGTPSFVNATGNGADGWRALSYLELSNAFDRGIALQGAFGDINTDDPDLTAFKARGGKLIHYTGLADTLIFPQGSIAYYERVAATMGGFSSVQDFYRMYLVPGLGHGPWNGTANSDANPPLPAPGQIYSLLTDWVEKGIAPDNVTVKSATTLPVEKSLPLCAYPLKANHVSGNPLSASSFACR